MIKAHDELVGKVANDLEAAGCTVKMEARTGVWGLWGSHRFDMLCQKGDKTVAIEMKRSRLGLSDIRRIKELVRPVKELGAERLIVCVPDEAFSQTAGSVLAYAAQVGVQVSTVDGLKSVIADM